MLLIVISQTAMYAVLILTSGFCFAGPNGRICLFAVDRCCSLALHGRIKVYFTNFILYNVYVYRLNFIVNPFAHFTCIAHMHTVKNFEMLYLKKNDIMGGLNARDIVVLMEVSQITL